MATTAATKLKVLAKNELKLEIVELQTESYHVFVHILVNNKKLRMLLDTGASKTVIDKTTVDTKFKSTKVESSANPTSSLHATVHTSDVMTVKTIQLANAKLSNYMITVIDLTHVNQTYASVKCKPIQGILGSDILVDKHALIDYGKKLIKFKTK